MEILVTGIATYINEGLWHACTTKQHVTTKKKASTYWKTYIKVQCMSTVKKNLKKKWAWIECIMGLTCFFTDEWSEMRTRSIVPLPGFEHVDTITSTSECFTIEAGITWIPVCDANARVRMVPYVSTLGILVV